MAHHRTAYSYRLRLVVTKNEEGDATLVFPPEALALLGVGVNDEISLQVAADGSIAAMAIKQTNT